MRIAISLIALITVICLVGCGQTTLHPVSVMEVNERGGAAGVEARESFTKSDIVGVQIWNPPSSGKEDYSIVVTKEGSTEPVETLETKGDKGEGYVSRDYRPLKAFEPGTYKMEARQGASSFGSCTFVVKD